MREVRIGGAVTVILAATFVGALAFGSAALAQQQPSVAAPDGSDQTATPPAKPPHRTHSSKALPAAQPDPDLDTNDQLAPSQIKQPMPAAVAEPASGASRKQSRPVMHTATDTPAPPAAPAARPAPAPRGVAGSTVIDCAKGPFSKDSSHLRLAMTFDSKNVSFTEVEAAGGSKVPASVVFPNDPKRRLEVWWSNPAERRDTYLIDIHGKSIWQAPDGMKLGLTLPQLEKLNHKPFKIKGFDKDGTATVSDWDGGALASLAGGCKSGVTLKADPKAPPAALSALSPDKEYMSTDPEMKEIKPTISEILIGY